MESRPKIQKLKQSKKAKTLVQEVSGAFREKCWGAADFGVLCHVVYCAAVITYNIQQKKNRAETIREKSCRIQKLPCEERIEKKICALRKEKVSRRV